MAWRSASLTRIGAERRVNEDSLLDRPDLGLWAVADGVGGHAAGDVASRLVLDGLEAALAKLGAPLDPARAGAAAEAAIAEANARLLEKAEALGTRSLIATTVAVLIAGGGIGLCLWAGDSRIYLVRDDALYQLTRDHTIASDEAAAGRPVPTNPRAAHTLTRAIGAVPGIQLDWASIELLPTDILVLCTDGISHVLAPGQMADAIESDPDLTVQALAAEALAAGGRDDLSVIAIRSMPR